MTTLRLSPALTTAPPDSPNDSVVELVPQQPQLATSLLVVTSVIVAVALLNDVPAGNVNTTAPPEEAVNPPLAEVLNVVVNAVVEPASLPGATTRFTFDTVTAGSNV